MRGKIDVGKDTAFLPTDISDTKKGRREGKKILHDYLENSDPVEAAPTKQNSTKTACHRLRFIYAVKSGCENEFCFWNVNSKFHTWKQIRNFLT